MSIVLAGLIGAVVAFLVLFKPGRFLLVRHIVAFALAALVTGILCMWTFESLYPYGPLRARNYAHYMVMGTIAGILAPILGSVAALLWRRRRRATSPGGSAP